MSKAPRSAVRFLVPPALAALLAGCISSESANLTPRHLPREKDNLYHFETSWRTNRRGVNTTNVHAYVVLGENLWPMKPVPFAQNRFEATVPLPAGRTYIPYRYKYDFDYPGIGLWYKGSDLSPSYRLIVPADPSAPIESNQPR